MDYKKVIGFIGSLGVGLLLAAAGLRYDAKALFYAGTVLLAVVVVAWLFFWAHPLSQTIAGPTGPDAARIEETRERQERRRKIIDDARKMVAQFEINGGRDWSNMARKSPAYSAVQPHLADEFKRSIEARQRAIVVGAIHQEPVAGFLRELDRLEREWGLS